MLNKKNTPPPLSLACLRASKVRNMVQSQKTRFFQKSKIDLFALVLFIYVR